MTDDNGPRLRDILLLFLFLGFLEDCGYLARVAYLMDRIMRTMNLHGRAFVPMLSGQIGRARCRERADRYR